MHKEAMLTQLGYVANDALLNQLQTIEKNTTGYDKIKKHILDLHEHLKVDNGYVALSNSNDYFKIKIDSASQALADEAHQKVKRFCDKYKVNIKKLENKNTYYILGFKNK